MCLRMFRVFRMLRNMKHTSPFFFSLWRLVSQVLHSWSTNLAIPVFIFIFLYLFACIGVNVIYLSTDWHNTAVEDQVYAHFGSISKAMLTVFRFSIVDSVAIVYEPIILAKPLTMLFFLPVVFFIVFTIVNVVTATLVDNVFVQNQEDVSLRARILRQSSEYLVPKLREAFRKLDTDVTGEITKEDIPYLDFTGCDGIKGIDISHILTPELLVDRFDYFDVDMQGTITEDEFVTGVLTLVFSDAQSLEMTEALHLLRRIAKGTLNIQRTVRNPYGNSLNQGM